MGDNQAQFILHRQARLENLAMFRVYRIQSLADRVRQF
jgi:hypothetical protein